MYCTPARPYSRRGRMVGIHPHCITIDETAREYMPDMYGAANNVVIKDGTALAYRIAT